MKIRKKKGIFSLQSSPTLHPVQTPYSTRLHIAFNKKIREPLARISTNPRYNQISINYNLLKKWLVKGIKFNPLIYPFIEKTLFGRANFKELSLEKKHKQVYHRIKKNIGFRFNKQFKKYK